MRIVLRNGEFWAIRRTKRGWRAECDKLELTATAATMEALLAEIDFVMEALCV